MTVRLSMLSPEAAGISTDREWNRIAKNNGGGLWWPRSNHPEKWMLLGKGECSLSNNIGFLVIGTYQEGNKSTGITISMRGERNPIRVWRGFEFKKTGDILKGY